MQTVMAEFGGRRAGYFRPKPVFKIGRTDCPICGKVGHVGRTTCEVKTIPYNWRERHRQKMNRKAKKRAGREEG